MKKHTYHTILGLVLVACFLLSIKAFSRTDFDHATVGNLRQEMAHKHNDNILSMKGRLNCMQEPDQNNFCQVNFRDYNSGNTYNLTGDHKAGILYQAGIIKVEIEGKMLKNGAIEIINIRAL